MANDHDPKPGTCGFYRQNDCPNRAFTHHDRHGIYSGRACDDHAKDLPGQGAMWDYEAEEPIDPEEGPLSPYQLGDLP